MIKRILSLTFAALLCISALSCTSMKSRHFVGQKKILAENELSQESVWKMGKDVFLVRRLDDSKLIVSSMGWDKKTQAYSVASYPLVVSELGEYTFLNIKDGDLYTILRLVGAEGDAVVLLTVDKDKLETDIETGQIEAYKDDHAFIFSGSKAALDRYIQTNIDTLFSLEAVGIAELISGELK
jgi:hypothetical protein